MSAEEGPKTTGSYGVYNINAECKNACLNVMARMPEAVGCGIVNLGTGAMLTFHHRLPELPPHEIALIAGAVVDMFCGGRTRRMEGHVDQLLRERVLGYADEIFRSTPTAYYFLKSVRKYDLVGILIAPRTINQGLGWLALRNAVGQLAQTVTRRLVRQSLFEVVDPEQAFESGVPLTTAIVEPQHTVSDSTMSLTGAIGDFGLSSAFQLISHQQKSGKLLIFGEEGGLQVIFERGRVISAWYDRETAATGLRELLVREIPREDLRRVADYCRKQRCSVPRAMFELGFHDEEQLEQTCSQLICQRIYKAFQWQGGNYAFFSEEDPDPGLRIAPIPVDGLLFTAALISDELPLIKAIFTDEEVIVARLPLSEELLAELEGPARELHPKLPAEPTPLGTLLRSYFMTELNTLRALYALHKAGGLTVSAPLQGSLKA